MVGARGEDTGRRLHDLLALATWRGTRVEAFTAWFSAPGVAVHGRAVDGMMELTGQSAEL
jgi:hypothetical protein